MNMEKTILIVEDSPTIKYQVRIILQQVGLTLLEAGGELGLFNQVEQYGKLVDLVIMDLTLKDEDGFDLVKKLKANPNYSSIPIVILTEHADAKSVLTARELGVEGYIRKPIVRDEFLKKLKEILNI